jgi:hypothetical protein
LGQLNRKKRKLLKEDNMEPIEQKTPNFLDGVLDAVAKIPLDLEGMEDEEVAENQLSENVNIYDPKNPLPKRYFTRKDSDLVSSFSQFAGDVLKKESRPQLKQTLLSLRKSYMDHFKDDSGDLTPMQKSLIDAIVWLELVEHLAGTSALKFGVIKLNQSANKISLQPILEKNMIPIINTKRLLIKTLMEISREKVSRKMTISYNSAYDAEKMSDEELERRQRDLDAILGRFPVKSVTLTEVREER